VTDSPAAPSSWKIRALIVAAWTALCLLVTVAWTAPVVLMEPDPNLPADAHAAVVGSGVACAAGCTGSVWLLGLIVGLVIYALVRR